ncbi:MAG: glycosyltransferase, partial [Promethearchaeota archaeon]
YNAHNVETIYHQQIGKYYYKIPIFLRFFYSLYIFFLEKYAVNFVKNINAISHIDKANFLKIYNVPKEKIIVNKIGYKKEIFNNSIDKEIAKKRLEIDKDKFVIIFHGNYYGQKANKEAIEIIINKIGPQIQDKDILFLIAGNMPKFKNTRNIRFLGFVDDLNSFLYAADIAIVPIFRGSGVRVKMIDYLSAKLPMITTKQAKLGLIFKNNEHGYIVSDKRPIEEIIERILELKENPEKINEFKNNIKKLLEEEYSWDKILKFLGERYRKILARN